jgi:hypothetical protein
MTIKEETLRVWSKKPSDSEQDRIDRTERMIRDAISSSEDLRVKNAQVFTKGSVKANTNIRAASDIDICIQADGVFFCDYPEGKDNSDFNNHSVDYSFSEFRNNVEKALVDYFGSSSIDMTGSKAIHINNTVSNSRIDADVVPAFEHRRYSDDGNYLKGIEIRSRKDVNSKTINWPHHNYDNNLYKHNNTSHRYRKMVRILKRIRETMLESDSNLSHDAQSFLIESIVWNVPDDRFGFDNYEDDLRGILDYLKLNLSSFESVKEWGEVNELKYLFSTPQKWTRAGALLFINNCSDFLDRL